MEVINVLQKFELFEEQWTPKIIGALNGQHVKLARVAGDFVWHNHEHEDELFWVLKGQLIMEFRDKTVEIGPGEMIIVPKGVEHCPRTKDGQEVFLLLFEPQAIKHTGEVQDKRTVTQMDWI
ncbi:MAG: cupin domain-containing protein [Bacteroidota bacterium]